MASRACVALLKLTATIATLLAVAFACSPSQAQVPDLSSFDRTFSHQYFVSGAVKIHYVTGGHGPPLVLRHGFPETWYAWRKVMPRLARSYTLIVPDLRGAGQSDKPASGYDKRTMASDIHMLVRSLGLAHVDLVGHDVGAGVAFAYAATHREEVDHLALLDVAPQGTKAFDEMARKSWVFKFQQQRDFAESLVAGREKLYLSSGFLLPLAFDPTAFTEADLEEYARAYSAPGGMRAAFGWYRAFDQDIDDNRASLITLLPMPILGLGGAQSGGPTMAGMVAEIGTNVQSAAIDRCGHWMAEEQPDALVSHLLAFLSRRP